MDPRLLEFITHARQKGMDHGTIRVLLLSADWKEKDIARGLAAQGLDMPVPEPLSSGGAREAFQYLMVFSAMVTAVVNVILILFHYLDQMLPDPATDIGAFSEYRQNTIRWSIAALLVSAPLFFGFAGWIGRDLVKSPERSKSPIRRWLTYLTLFVAATTMTVDSTTLIYGFLQGELTTRFLLKTLAVLVLALMVFCYYFLSLKPYEPERAATLRRLNWSFGGIAAVVVGLAVTLGYLLVESPFIARLRRFDERRIADLQAIESAIARLTVEYVFTDGDNRERKLKRPLPANLAELNDWLQSVEHSRPLNLGDPQTGKPYEYRIKSVSSYELCAEFSLAEEEGVSPWAYRSPEHHLWNHPQGRHCFEVDVLKW